ncbi:ATPase, T2SS/T4P/T4SS family [Coxiella endosymbiont of Ornithodoros amblus]|uniref:ATPase, T2SS/T4P/T4SS family n=1 Tax=Coxiella endosymbiont of Ornithodoros amblus TaxID=1656166 RepID=UPI003CC7429F
MSQDPQSGKTVSFYAALNQLNSTQENISTVEDPIEIQYLISPLYYSLFYDKIPMLSSVGAIRDFETASVSVHAAHTGHLVLSILHTNSVVKCITRLIDMGIEPFNLKC